MSDIAKDYNNTIDSAQKLHVNFIRFAARDAYTRYVEPFLSRNNLTLMAEDDYWFIVSSNDPDGDCILDADELIELYNLDQSVRLVADLLRIEATEYEEFGVFMVDQE